jgi:hypothetical protein
MSDIDDAISKLWKDANASFMASIPISQVVVGSDEQNANLPDNLCDWISLYDEFANWMISLTTLVAVAPLVLEVPVTDAHHRAFIPLLGSITSQIVAIRRLVLAGLDMPAKQICRSLVEHIDVGVRMTLDDSALKTFLANPDVEGRDCFGSS